jgi:hypothetical protein
MKTLIPNPRPRQQASVLVIGLIIAAILGATLTSYLALTLNQQRSVVRSQTWSTSLALSESGIEEALAYINKYAGSFTEITNWVNDAAVDGWTVAGNVYHMQRTVDASVGHYDVYVTNNASGAPTIYAVGSAAWKFAAAPAGAPFFAAVGLDQGTTTSTARPEIARQVYVQTQKSALFTVAMVSLGRIDLRGKNVGTDSFDSADALYSNGGLYPLGDLSKTKATGSVITTSTLIDSLNVGNAKIKGMVKTGPNGSISIGPNGSVGDRNWVESGKTGIMDGYSANDVNLEFPSVELPSTFYLPPVPANPKPTIGGVVYDYVLPSGNYSLSSISGKNIYIATNAQVKLHITGDVNLSGQEQLTISPQNSSLSIYMAGSTFKVAGNAAINNLSQNAANFAYYGLPSNTSVQMLGNASFTGSIYAPQANLILGGGGSDTYDFVGGSVSKTVTMNGHYNFHYDENLARVGPSRGYIPTSWVEK